MEGDGTYAGNYAVAREKSHDDAERMREKGWRRERRLNVRLGIDFPYLPAPFSGVFVHICMQVLAVIVHVFFLGLRFDP